MEEEGGGISIFDIEMAKEKNFMIGGEKKNKLLFMYVYVRRNK